MSTATSGSSTAVSSYSSNTTAATTSIVIQRQSTRSSAAIEVPIWLIFCYSVILLCAIVGNLLVISTLVQNRRMRTITNVFLLNLAISDILLGVLCMPVTLVGTLLRHFIFGEFFCKLIQFSQAASVAVSSWTLVAISCERYYAICHPLRSRRWQTRSHAYKIIAFIWFGSMLCMLPIAMFSQLMPTSRQGRSKCRDNWPSYALPYERTYNLFLDLILLVLPLMILSVAYILITRTLYVGMRIEKAMIFGGKQEEVSTPLPRNLNSSLGKTSLLSSSSSSATSSSRLKLNLSLRCQGPASGHRHHHHQDNLDNNMQKTDTLYQQQQQQHNNGKHQLQAQRMYNQHQFQNYHHHHQQQQQQQQTQQHHHQIVLHEEEAAQPHNKHCCETIVRLCCKRSAPSTSANSYSGRPHLYCMRFATLKTTLPDKDANFCTSECCSSNFSYTTNSNNLADDLPTSSTTAAAAAAVGSSSSSYATTYRYPYQQQQQQQQHQQQYTRCCYEQQQIMPQFQMKTAGKLKIQSTKRSFKGSESVLRRNNIAKNLESKNRVIKMLSVLVLEFFICWTPLYVINTVAMYIGSAIYEYIDYTSISVLQLLAYSSSCCNPITYCFMNANFRRAFWDTFKGMQWCGKRFQRKRSTPHNTGNLCLAGSIRVNSYTVQTVIDSPRL